MEWNNDWSEYFGASDSQTAYNDLVYTIVSGSLATGMTMNSDGHINWDVPDSAAAGTWRAIIKVTDEGVGSTPSRHSFAPLISRIYHGHYDSTRTVTDPPASVDDYFHVDVNGSLSGTFLYQRIPTLGRGSSDAYYPNDLDGGYTRHEPIVVTAPSHASVFSVAAQGGDGVVNFTPPVNFEGLTTGSYRIDQPSAEGTVNSIDWVYNSNTGLAAPIVFEVGKAVRADIDIDLPRYNPDATQEISRWHTYDSSADDTKSGIVAINDDDDDANQIADLKSIHVPGEDDLIPMRLGYWLRDDAKIDDFTAHLEVTINDVISVWTTPDKQAGTEIHLFGPGRTGNDIILTNLPEKVWVEGLAKANIQLKLNIQGPDTALFTDMIPPPTGAASATSDSNAINLLVGVGLTAYRPTQTDGELDFGRVPVPEKWEESLEHGPGIRINGDFDFLDPIYYDPIAEGPAARDYQRVGVLVPNENDLIEVRVDTIPGLTGLVLETNSDAILLYPSAQKGNLIPFDDETRQTDPIQFTSGTATVYVEWAEFAHGTAELYLLNPATGERIDTLLFSTFHGMQLQLSGETAFDWSRPWNRIHRQGTQIGEALYREGYDVHYWEEKEVNLDADWGLGALGVAWTAKGRAVEQLRNHVQNHLVETVDMIGYSHGAGKIYELGSRFVHAWLQEQAGTQYNVGVAGYIDAVNATGLGSTFQFQTLRSKPHEADYLVNAYQTNGALHGMSIIYADEEKNFDYVPDMDHFYIDDYFEVWDFMLNGLRNGGLTR